MGIKTDKIDAIAISHMHPDHCGGMKAKRNKEVKLPDEIEKELAGKKCFVPENVETGKIKRVVVN